MKKIFSLLLVALMIFSFTACGGKEYKAVTPDEVVAEYKNAGFEVFYKDYTSENEIDYIHYIKAEKDSQSAYIYFYESEDEAKAAAEKMDKNAAIIFFSLIFGDVTVINAKQYGKVVIEYESKEFLKPLKEIV